MLAMMATTISLCEHCRTVEAHVLDPSDIAQTLLDTVSRNGEYLIGPECDYDRAFLHKLVLRTFQAAVTGTGQTLVIIMRLGCSSTLK